MRIFNGKRRAEKILLKLKEKILKDKIIPVLSVISVGENPASKLFIRNKKQAAKRIGIKVNHYNRFQETVSEEEIIQKIEELNNDRVVNGIIVQLPLPKKLNAKKIVRKISPRKDVDGFHKRTHFSSPLISAILVALKDSTKKPKGPEGKLSVSYGAGKKIIALVNSDFFGRALKSFLKREAIKISYLKNPAPTSGAGRGKKSPKIKSADIVITVCGCPNLIKGNMIKKEAILIDGGIIVLKNKKVVGDVDKKSVAKKARFLTPVPGGLGPLTVAFLLKNVYLSKINDFRR